jgi:predicted RNase H-like nuclease (RuvC/YqgF family)
MTTSEKLQNMVDQLELENAELRRQLEQARNIAALLESESYGGADCG